MKSGKSYIVNTTAKLKIIHRQSLPDEINNICLDQHTYTQQMQCKD